MGAGNALSVYSLYAGKVPPTSLQILVYMALRSMDSDAKPWYSESAATLAALAIGRRIPADPDGRLQASAADVRAVERAITPLYVVGAITIARHSYGRPGQSVGRSAIYRLWLIEPAPAKFRGAGNKLAPDEFRGALPPHGIHGVLKSDHPMKTVGHSGHHPTKSGSPPHEFRGPRGVQEEELKQDQDSEAPEVNSNVEGTSAGTDNGRLRRAGDSIDAEHSEHQRRISELRQQMAGTAAAAKLARGARARAGPLTAQRAAAEAIAAEQDAAAETFQ